MYGENSNKSSRTYPLYTLQSLKLDLREGRLIEDLSQGSGTYFMEEQSYYSAVFSLLQLRQKDFTGSFPPRPHKFWVALTRGLDTRAQDQKITGSNPWTCRENVDRREAGGGMHFFIPPERGPFEGALGKALCSRLLFPRSSDRKPTLCSASSL